MRVLIAVVAVIVIFAVIGWFQFGTSDGEPSIRVDTDKIERDTNSIVDSVQDTVDEVDRRVDVTVDASKDSDADR